MNYKPRYSIGEVSTICNISKKALRYYDNIGIITTQRKDYNNYRYYTHESLLAVPVIKFYKQMGFKLEEMREFIEGNLPNVYSAIRNSFLHKIEELEREQEEIRQQHISVKDWYDLILEAEMVLDNNISEVSVKYVELGQVLCYNQPFDQDIRTTVINIDFANFVEEIGNKITGPVILCFPSVTERIQNTSSNVQVLQRTILPCPPQHQRTLQGSMMAACYHIGAHELIDQTYEKICRWAREHGYTLAEESFERYVTDYWTTRNCHQFVTEVLIKVSRPGGAQRIARKGEC